MPRIQGSHPGRFFSGVHAPSASHLNTTPLPPGSNSGTSGDGGDDVEDYALDDPPTESSAAEPPAQSPSKEERQAVLATGKTTYAAESPAPAPSTEAREEGRLGRHVPSVRGHEVDM